MKLDKLINDLKSSDKQNAQEAGETHIIDLGSMGMTERFIVRQGNTIVDKGNNLNALMKKHNVSKNKVFKG